MIIEATTLKSLAGVRHAFFSRLGGVSDGIYASLNGGVGSADSPEAVTENRARMARILGVAADHLLTCYQIHSPTVIVAEEPWDGPTRPHADAIVTTTRGLAIGISTADCTPVLFADIEAGVVGAAHAGWRGALAGVTDETIAAMGKLGASPQRIRAAIGPTIRQPNYEVGPEVVANFLNADAANVRFFRPSTRAAHSLFDLPRYIAARLAAVGIVQIEDVGLCTYAEPDRFYSYRRATHRGEPDYGRHVNAIALV